VERGSSAVNLWYSDISALDLIIKNSRKMRIGCFNGVDCHCSLYGGISN
jgi:hypothetical protein